MKIILAIFSCILISYDSHSDTVNTFEFTIISLSWFPDSNFYCGPIVHSVKLTKVGYLLIFCLLHAHCKGFSSSSFKVVSNMQVVNFSLLFSSSWESQSAVFLMLQNDMIISQRFPL